MEELPLKLSGSLITINKKRMQLQWWEWWIVILCAKGIGHGIQGALEAIYGRPLRTRVRDLERQVRQLQDRVDSRRTLNVSNM